MGTRVHMTNLTRSNYHSPNTLTWIVTLRLILHKISIRYITFRKEKIINYLSKSTIILLKQNCDMFIYIWIVWVSKGRRVRVVGRGDLGIISFVNADMIYDNPGMILPPLPLTSPDPFTPLLLLLSLSPFSSRFCFLCGYVLRYWYWYMWCDVSINGTELFYQK